MNLHLWIKYIFTVELRHYQGYLHGKTDGYVKFCRILTMMYYMQKLFLLSFSSSFDPHVSKFPEAGTAASSRPNV